MGLKIVYFLCISLISSACYAETIPPKPTHLESLDQQLEELHKEVHALRLKSMQEEIRSQPLMFEQWAKYADHIKKSEQYEEKADKVQKKIDLLEAQRKQLLHAQDSQQTS